MLTATLTSKGQITIPQAVRDALGLHAGSKVDFVPVADGFKLVPPRSEAASLKGRFAGRVAKPVSIAAMDPAVTAEALTRAADYDRWVRAKMQASRDDPRPAIADDEGESIHAAKRADRTA
jgi:antitoxin PrlF